jgi:hypothetical protein
MVHFLHFMASAIACGLIGAIGTVEDVWRDTGDLQRRTRWILRITLVVLMIFVGALLVGGCGPAGHGPTHFHHFYR